MLADRSFFRRLKFYIFGFLIGALIVNVIFKGKACRMPGTIKLEELTEQKITYNNYVRCLMICQNIDTNQLKTLLVNGKINYGKSNVHNTPCPSFVVEVDLKEDKKNQIVIEDCDSISKIVSIGILDQAKTCKCN